MFRRRRIDEAEGPAAGPDLGIDATTPDPPEGAIADPSAVATTGEPVASPQGPWDLDGLPEDDSRERLDFGGLRIFVPEDTDLRVDFGAEGEIVALTLAHPSPSGEPEQMQLSAFAAPRTSGIWAEVRAEIAEGVATSGGRIESAEGIWGPELRARLVTDQPGVLAPARFLGIDGPRWFLRALVTGPSAADGVDHPVLTEALRAVVVVRGKEAMAPRDALPLSPPSELQEQMMHAVDQAQAQAED
jgi:hypothetical protein